jgi:hypothetical protein
MSKKKKWNIHRKLEVPTSEGSILFDTCSDLGHLLPYDFKKLTGRSLEISIAKFKAFLNRMECFGTSFRISVIVLS